MTRTGRTALVLGLLAGAACGRGPETAAAPPLVAGSLRGRNVLLVTIDTLRRDRLGAYGHGGSLTPTLDGLAAQGVRYAHAFSHVPQTLPAHTSILTGRTPVRHGVHLNGTTRLADDVPTLATVAKAAGYRTGAFVGAFVLDARFGLTRGFDRYDDRYPQPSGTSFAFAERRGADVVQAAGDWIAAPGATGPWLAWVHLFDPHAPYDAPAEYRAAGRSPYDAEVAYADAMIGRLLDGLDPPTRARTVVVATADHGESLGEHGETTHGLFAYDATLAVPLVISGGVPTSVVEAPVGHADLLPTLADLLGWPTPPGVDGQSLVPAPPADRVIYFEALDAHLTRDWAPLTGVVGREWKYIHLPIVELYDRRTDAAEAHNVAAAQADRVQVLDRDRVRLSQAPAAAPAARLDLQAEQRLRALGYTSGASPAPAAARAYTETDDPKRLVALHERFDTALTAFSTGRPAEALDALQAVLRERADFLSARTAAAAVLQSTGRAADAVALLRAAPADQRERGDLQAKLGAALRDAGDLKGAAIALERSRQLGYANPEVRNDLGVVYARLGRIAEARAELEALVAAAPNAAGAWNNLGVLEMNARRLEAAARAFRAAVAADASRGEAWEGLGAALVGTDRAAAVDAWRRAEALLPRNFDLLFNLGMVLASGPTPADARPYLTRFLREAPAAYDRDRPQVQAALRGLPQ